MTYLIYQNKMHFKLENEIVIKRYDDLNNAIKQFDSL
jgi:hypothetical protein